MRFDIRTREYRQRRGSDLGFWFGWGGGWGRGWGWGDTPPNLEAKSRGGGGGCCFANCEQEPKTEANSFPLFWLLMLFDRVVVAYGFCFGFLWGGGFSSASRRARTSSIIRKVWDMVLKKLRHFFRDLHIFACKL